MSRLVSRQAPDFKAEGVLEGQFKEYTLADFKDKWLILFFYPLDFTFVCPTEILAYSDRISEFKDAGAEVVGVSIDSKFTHLAWTQRDRKLGGIEGLQYPLLSDMNKQMVRAFDVLADGGVALRGLFLIDPDGVVQHATINNLAIGRSVDETLRVLHAAQFARENGEVCPANWKPGDEGMKADPEGSKTWFEKQTVSA